MKQEAEHVVIFLPSDFYNKSVKGTIHFYKPDNANKDKRIRINGSEGQIQIPRAQLSNGAYTVNVHCSVDGSDYFYSHSIFL